MDVWGNPDDDQKNQDLVSHPDFHNILKVNDVNENNDAKVALHAINNSTNQNARALKVEGMAEIDRLRIHSIEGNQIVVDTTGNDKLRIGSYYAAGDIFLGKDGRVVEIEGTPLKLKGYVQAINLDSDEDDLHLGTLDTITNDVILSRTGQETKVQGSLNVAETTTMEGQLTTRGQVVSEGQFTAEGILMAEGHLKVGPSDAEGHIDSNGSEEDPQDLYLGPLASTKGVVIGRSGHGTAIQSPLYALEGLSVGQFGQNGYVDAEGSGIQHLDLDLGTRERTWDVNISRSGQTTSVKGRLDAEENIRVGTAAADGKIDCQANNRNLKMGSQNNTNNVELSRTGKTVIAKGRLDANEHIRVGTAAADGLIDCQANNRNLKIGTQNITRDVRLSRAGQTVDLFGQLRTNFNAMVMNDAIDINDPAACGIVLNPAGHPLIPGPTLDFVLLGLVVACIDPTGIYHQNP